MKTDLLKLFIISQYGGQRYNRLPEVMIIIIKSIYAKLKCLFVFKLVWNFWKNQYDGPNYLYKTHGVLDSTYLKWGFWLRKQYEI